ncbi:hypothetical protein [uncultured Friedmanniella sp.]|uniref:hypothetical protein n=1 Tax=uncultured Friedmanniella sp. TaxID=335381 RepID=UPI0035CBE9C7
MSHPYPTPGSGEDRPPLLGSAPTRRTSRVTGFSFTRSRIVPVVGLLALIVLGSLLPYLAMPYINYAAELAQENASLFPAATFIRGVDPLWLPGYQPGPATATIQLALTMFNLGPSFQQIGVVVAVLFCWALFQDEINKFFWWPLHLSGWLLALAPVPLFVGLHQLHSADVDITVRIGWLPVALAGVLILVATFRARSRIDTYASI